MTDKIKVIVEYTDYMGQKKTMESECPAYRKEVLWHVISVVCNSGANIPHVPTTEKEDSILDYICRGKF